MSVKTQSETTNVSKELDELILLIRNIGAFKTMMSSKVPFGDPESIQNDQGWNSAMENTYARANRYWDILQAEILSEEIDVDPELIEKIKFFMEEKIPVMLTRNEQYINSETNSEKIDSLLAELSEMDAPFMSKDYKAFSDAIALYRRTKNDLCDAERINRMTETEYNLRQTVFKRANSSLISTCRRYLTNHYGPKGIGFRDKRFGKMMELCELLDMNTAMIFAGEVSI